MKFCGRIGNFIPRTAIRRPCQHVDFLANLLDRKSTMCKTKQQNSFLQTNIFRALLKSLVHASFLVVWTKVISFTVRSQRSTHLLMFFRVLKSYNFLMFYLSIWIWLGGVWYFVLWRYNIIVFSIEAIVIIKDILYIV